MKRSCPVGLVLLLVSSALCARAQVASERPPVWTGRVDDVVSPKVVSLTVESGRLQPGQLGVALREGSETARLEVKTAAGVCRVASGETRKGDIVLGYENAAPPGPSGNSGGKVTEPPQGQLAATTNELPAHARELLLAEGCLEAAAKLCRDLPAADRKAFEDDLDKAGKVLPLIYPACRAALASSAGERVALSLRDAFRGDLAVKLGAFPDPRLPPLAPRYPGGSERFLPGSAAAYGTVSLITSDPAAWAAPGYWGEPPQSPVFAGWTLEEDVASFTNGSTALIRRDFALDDAEMTGELRADDGACVFLVLRSDVVVKFHPGTPQARGNVSVKFGYDNLRMANAWGKGPEIARGKWVPFRVCLAGDSVQVFVDGVEALRTALSAHPDTASGRRAGAGHFGLGGDSSSGAFRQVRLTALGETGRHAMPRLQEPPAFAADGQPVKMLEGPEEAYESLVHNRSEPRRQTQHEVKDGVLTITGAPYVQLARKDTASDHFVASGDVRFLAPGSVWLRANAKLLFGLHAAKPGAEPAGEAAFCTVKHSTGNFHSSDESASGQPLELNKWYSWELAYHEPVGVLRLDGRAVMIAAAPAARDRTECGPNQFGVSSYNTKVEVRNVTIARQRPGRTASAPAMAWAKSSFADGFRALDRALALLGKERSESAAAALGILRGSRPPHAASVEDFVAVAGNCRASHDWPLSLALLDANQQRFGEKDPWRAAAAKEWEVAKQKYELAIESVEAGEIGLNNTIRTGDGAGGGAWPAADGRRLWAHARGLNQLLLFDPEGWTVERRIPFKGDLRRMSARAAYAICVGAADSRRVTKIDLANGAELGAAEFPRGRVLDIAADPRRPRLFVSVDENEKPDMVDFGLCRIYAVDEETMTISATDGIGMFLAADPLGRYLHAGLSAQWRPGLSLETSFLPVVPAFGYADHLVSYRLRGTNLVCCAQRPVPGIGGASVVAGPSGAAVCYVGRRGAPAGVDEGTSPHLEAAVCAYRSVGVERLVGRFECGANPLLMAFNPVRAEAYIYNGTQVRCFDSLSFTPKTTLELPQQVDAKAIVGLCVSPRGNELIVTYGSKSGGVYVQRLAAATDAAAEEYLPADPLQAAKTAAVALAGGRADAPAAKLLLEKVAARMAYTEAGEAAARALLESEQNPWVRQGEPFMMPPVELKDLDKDVSTDSLLLPAEQAAVTMASEDTNSTERIADLASLAESAEGFPCSWLWQCRQAVTQYPHSGTIRLLAVRRLEAAGSFDAATRAAGELLGMTNAARGARSGACMSLARIYRARNDRPRETASLVRALELAPRDPFLNVAMADACDAAGCPRRAEFHRLVSWRLYPSQPDLGKRLAEAGIVKADTPSTLDATAVFKKASPSVVLVTQGSGCGTGFIVGRNGFLLSNHHVIAGAKDLQVKLIEAGTGKERSVPADVIASDAQRDIALLRLRLGDIAVEPLVLADSDKVETGARVVAIGNPGLGARILTHTATEGIISSVNRPLGAHRFLQTSAAVNPGNSGGPLLDQFGRVVGMVTLKSSLENVGFAIPANDMAAFIREACDAGQVPDGMKQRDK